MLHRRIDSFLGTLLFAAIVPLVLFSAIRTRIGFAWPRRKARSPARFPKPLPSAAPIAGEFQFDRAIEAYEHLIDSVVAEKQA